MVKFKIPEEIKEGFRLYFEFTQAQKNKIFNLLNEESIGTDPTTLAKKVSLELDIEFGDLETVFIAMFSLLRAVESSNLNEEEFLNEIILALKDSKNSNSAIKKDLLGILSNKHLKLSRKAGILASNRQYLLVSTRIISDIRPVYGVNDEQDELKSSIIVHNLKVDYVENNQIRTMYFAIDKKDLDKIKKDVERAKMKEKNIRDKFKVATDFIELS